MKSILLMLILCISTSACVHKLPVKFSEVRIMESSLKQALRKSTKLVVKVKKQTRSNYETSLVFESSDYSDIASFVKGIKLNDDGRGVFYTCSGDVTVEFFRGEKLSSSINFSSTSRLKWVKGSQWKGDARLSNQSEEYLANWFYERNVDEQVKELEKVKVYRRELERKLKKAFKGLPQSLKSNYLEPEEFASILKKEYKNANEQLYALFFIFGAEEDWSGFDNLDNLIDVLISAYEPAELQQAFRQALLGENKQRQSGAVRFWESYRSPLKQWKPNDIIKLKRVMIAVKKSMKKIR